MNATSANPGTQYGPSRTSPAATDPAIISGDRRPRPIIPRHGPVIRNSPLSKIPSKRDLPASSGSSPINPKDSAKAGGIPYHTEEKCPRCGCKHRHPVAGVGPGGFSAECTRCRNIFRASRVSKEPGSTVSRILKAPGTEESCSEEDPGADREESS
jgi:hypothetical protein